MLTITWFLVGTVSMTGVSLSTGHRPIIERMYSEAECKAVLTMLRDRGDNVSRLECKQIVVVDGPEVFRP